jgi:hypothetical protein
MMSGFLYRVAVAIKNLGERLRWGGVIQTGLGLKDWVMNHGKN